VREVHDRETGHGVFAKDDGVPTRRVIETKKKVLELREPCAVSWRRGLVPCRHVHSHADTDRDQHGHDEDGYGVVELVHCYQLLAQRPQKRKRRQVGSTTERAEHFLLRILH
jgi:hypothetical protein